MFFLGVGRVNLLCKKLISKGERGVPLVSSKHPTALRTFSESPHLSNVCRPTREAGAIYGSVSIQYAVRSSDQRSLPHRVKVPAAPPSLRSQIRNPCRPPPSNRRRTNCQDTSRRPALVFRRPDPHMSIWVLQHTPPSHWNQWHCGWEDRDLVHDEGSLPVS